MRKNSFTLIEMLSVAAIIGILAGIIFGVTRSVASRQAEIKTIAMLKEIEIALNECKRKFGYYPKQETCGDFQASLVVRNDDASGDTVEKKYSREFRKACNFSSFEIKDGDIVDAWGEPLQFKSDGKSFVVYSKGPDGESNAANDDDAKNEDNIYLD